MSTITGPGGVAPILPSGETEPLNIPVPEGDSGAPPVVGNPTVNIPQPVLFAGRMTGLGTATALGLASPRRSSADFEALFAQIAAKLKETEAQNRSDDAIARSEERRTAMTRAGSLLTALQQLGTTIDVNEENIRVKSARIDQINVELAPLYSQRTAYDQQIASYQSQINANNTTLGALGTQRNSLVNAYFAATSDAERTSIMNQIYAIDSQVYALHTANAGLSGSMNTVQGLRNVVQGQITELETERSAAEQSISNSQNAIVNAINQMIALILASLSILFGVMTSVQAGEMRAVGKTSQAGDDFEQELSRVLANANKVLQDRVDLRFMEEGATLGEGAGDSEQANGVATRFGAVGTVQSRALGFIAAVEAAIGALARLTGDSLMQNAGAMANAGNARMRVAV